MGECRFNGFHICLLYWGYIILGMKFGQLEGFDV